MKRSSDREKSYRIWAVKISRSCRIVRRISHVVATMVWRHNIEDEPLVKSSQGFWDDPCVVEDDMARVIGGAKQFGVIESWAFFLLSFFMKANFFSEFSIFVLRSPDLVAVVRC